MKKFFAIVALAATMFTVNTTVADAQSNRYYDEVNLTIARTNTNDYIHKGDDAFRSGRYKEAMDLYKRAREFNHFKGQPVVPTHEIDRKMDRCADAMRHAEHRDEMRRQDRSDATLGAAIIGGIIAAATSSHNNNQATAAQPAQSNAAQAAAAQPAAPDNSLVEVSRHGLSYTTMTRNTACSVVSVKNDDKFTVVEMEYINTDNVSNTLTLDKDTYLKDRTTGDKLKLRSTEGIATKGSTRVDAGDAVTFRLYFNRVSEGCQEVDIVEPGTSSWKFYHVGMK